MTTKSIVAACACAASLACAPVALAADDYKPGAEPTGRRFSAGMEVTRGDYGLSEDTTIIYIPLSYRLTSGPWQFGVTVPWISVDGPGTVVRDLGRISGGGASRSESGLGDIILQATRSLSTAASGLALDLTGKLKLGTASRSDGLGTGEEDFHVQLDAYGRTGEFTPFATLGYKFLGDPPGVNLRNVLYLDVGATRRIDERRSAGLLWHGQERVTAGVKPQSEINGYYLVQLDAAWKAQLYGIVGLADGSPDFGAGAFLIRHF
jgi:hypothetical protein